MQEVKSSNIHSVGYDDTTQTLKVLFKKGGEYHYQQVPNHVFEGLMKAESVGSYFAKNVRDIYQFTKVEK